MVKDANKPKGKMSAYAYFVQTCREEHKKQHPGESVVFAEFSRKCADKWKKMNPKEKKRFDDMAQQDKKRYEAEMKNYKPPPGEGKGKRKKKRTKDPNAPKRAMSGFFFYSQEERGKIKAANPTFSVGDIAKQLGKQWEKVTDKSRYEAMAKKDRARYEREMEQYKKGNAPSPNKKAKMSGKAAAAQQVEKSEEEEDEEDEEEEEEEEDEEEEDDEEDDE